MSKREPFSLWQSFSDLAMGLMAIFALILLLLMNQVSQEKVELEEARESFLRALLDTWRESFEIYESQEGVLNFVNAILAQKDCELTLSQDGTLLLKGSGDSPADLYAPDKFRLNPRGEDALRQCAENFELIAVCLSPEPNAQVRCLEATSDFNSNQKVSEQFREGIEAVVLQGNTDALRTRQRTEPIVIGNRKLNLPGRGESFVGNAYLGSERARKALGHLLDAVAKRDLSNVNSPLSPLEILMSRVRVESPSFGRFQAGPLKVAEDAAQAWRAHIPDNPSMPLCDGNLECDAARRLVLSLRWRAERLRAPFSRLNEDLCGLLEAEYLESAFQGELKTEQQRALERCRNALSDEASD